MDSNYTPLIDSKGSRTGQTSSHSDINVDLDDEPSELSSHMSPSRDGGRSRRQTVDAQPTRGFKRTQHPGGTGSSFSIQSSSGSHVATTSVDMSAISHLLKPKAAQASSGTGSGTGTSTGTISGSASSPSSPKQKSRTGTLERIPASAQQHQERDKRRDSIILAPHFHEQDASLAQDDSDDGSIISIPLVAGGLGQRAVTAPQAQVVAAFGPRPANMSPSTTSLEHLLSESKTGSVSLTPLPTTLGIVIVLNVGGTEYHTTPETLSRADPPSLLAWIAVHAVQSATLDQHKSPSRALSDNKTPSTPASLAAANLSNTLAALSLGAPANVPAVAVSSNTLSPRSSSPSSSVSPSASPSSGGVPGPVSSSVPASASALPGPVIGPITRRYTIDRNPRHFPYVLDYLRDKRIVLPKEDQALREIGLESKFYQLQGLFDAVQSALRDVISNQHLTPDDVFWRDCVLTLDRTFQDSSADGLPELGRNTFINMLRRLAFQQDPMLRVVHATYKGTREYRERCLEILRTNCTVCDRTVYYRPIGLREGRETGCPCHPPTGTWDRSKQLWTCCGSPQFQGSGCKQTGIHYTTWTFLGKS